MKRILNLKRSPSKKGIDAILPKDEDKILSNCDEILQGLYLGNYKAAKDKKFFKEKNITAVINCTGDLPNSFRNSKDVEYMRLTIDDSLKEKDFKKMTKYLPIAVDFIYKNLVLEKKNVLAHCVEGKARSCTVVAGFLMKYMNFTPKQAIDFIQKRRLEAFFYKKSINFETSMDDYYKELHKKK